MDYPQLTQLEMLQKLSENYEKTLADLNVYIKSLQEKVSTSEAAK